MKLSRSDLPIVVALVLLVLAGCSGFTAQGTRTPTDVPVGSAAVPVGTDTSATGTPTPPTDTPTAPPESDADGDGFTACEERELLAGADPGRMDVYVEIDWTAGARPDADALAELVAVYDDAPVENPGGEPGIALHLVYSDELPARDRPLSTLNLTHYADSFDNAGRGYHHAMFVEAVTGSALGRGVRGTILVQRVVPNRSPTLHANVFAHELGHSLGLTRRAFTGVDNFSLPFERYPSVMSQVGVFETIRFSNGTHHEDDFDDWGYLDENLYVPATGRLADAPAC